MIEVSNPEYLAKVAAFAESKGLADDLWRNLYRVHTFFDHTDYAGEPALWSPGQTAVPDAWRSYVNGRVTANVSPDFAPASFYILWRNPNGSTAMNGGLIYHGDQSGWTLPDGRVIPPGHGVETYSVTLAPVSGWSIHT
jgi:hypothetical protein